MKRLIKEYNYTIILGNFLASSNLKSKFELSLSSIKSVCCDFFFFIKILMKTKRKTVF